MATRLSAYLSLAALTLPGFLAVILGLVALGSAILFACWFRARKQYRDVLSLTGLSQQVLQTGMEPTSLYRVISAHMRRLTPHAALVVQIEPGRGQSRRLTIVEGGQVLDDSQYAEIGPGAYDWLKEHRQILVVPDFDRSPIEPLRLGGTTQSGLYIPLTVQDRFLGAISLQSPRRRSFGRRQQTPFAVSAEQIALGLDGARLYRKEQERSDQLMLIAEVSRKVAAILDLDTLFSDTVKLVADILGYYHASIFSLDRKQRIITMQASSNPAIQERGITVPWGTGLIGHAALGQVIVANDVRQDPRYLAHEALDRAAAEVALPLMVEDRVLGVLDLQSDRYGSFDEDEISILRILADQIAVAIEDSQIYRAQQEQSWVSTALLQVAEALAEESTLEEVAATVSRLAQLLTGVEHCTLLSYSAESDEFCLPVSGNAPGQPPSCMLRYPSEEIPALKRVAVSGTGISDPAALGPLARLWGNERENGHRMLAYPLAPRGSLMGVMLAQTPNSEDLPAPQRTILEGIARQAALAMDNAALLAAQREEAWVSTALLQVANVIASGSYDLDETVSTVVRLIPMLMGVSWCAILVREPEQHRYAGVASYGLTSNLQDLPATPLYSYDRLPWLDDLQQSNEIQTLDSPMDGSALGLEPADRGQIETLALALRAHQHDLGLLLVGAQLAAPALAGRRLTLLSGIASQASLAISATRLYEQAVRRERLEHEMNLAMDIQTSFLPECCPDVPGWRIAVEWRAARGVGGDYYDFVQLNTSQLGVSIADVSDKGVAAALYMALSRTVLRAAALDTRGPAATLERANRILLEDSRSGMFVSLVYGILDIEQGLYRFVRAGHNPPLLLRAADREILTLEPAGIVLGIVPDPALEEQTVELAPGDTLVLYTDGVTEAWNGDEQEFGINRLKQILLENCSLAPDGLIQRINEAVYEFVGNLPQADDYTMVVIQREPES